MISTNPHSFNITSVGYERIPVIVDKNGILISDSDRSQWAFLAYRHFYGNRHVNLANILKLLIDWNRNKHTN